MTSPNILTVVRLLLAFPFFFLLIACKNNSETFLIPAIGVFVVAISTDILDGFLARRHNLVSPLGMFLDPLADKALLLCGFTGLILAGNAFQMPHLGIIYLIYIRELIILGGFIILIFASYRSQTPILPTQPHWLGKWATASQMILLLMTLLNLNKLLTPVALLAGLLTLASGYVYVCRGLRFLFGKELCDE